jgi:phosphatidylinositol glycan class W
MIPDFYDFLGRPLYQLIEIAEVDLVTYGPPLRPSYPFLFWVLPSPSSISLFLLLLSSTPCPSHPPLCPLPSRPIPDSPFFLGAGRFYLLRYAKYQEHVSEYGVHWNFFFTLSFVSLFGVIADVPVRYTGILGIILIVFYQIWLSYFDLEIYIQEAARDNPLSQNREGVFSLFGYTSLYLISSHVGNRIMGPKKNARKWLSHVLELFLLGVGSWVVGYYGMERGIGIPPSRKMANITYVLYVIAVVVQPLAFFILLDLLVLPHSHLLLGTLFAPSLSLIPLPPPSVPPFYVV